MAESWLYLSCAGFFACLGLVIARPNRLSKTLFVILIIYYGSVTFINNRHWKDNITLYRNILKYIPERNPLHKNLARQYLKGGLYKEAFVHIRKFAQYFPESSERYLLEGEYYLDTNNIRLAIDKLNSAAAINKYYSQVYYKLSLCYDKLHNYDKRLEYALMADKTNPYSLEQLVWLGDLSSLKKQFEEATKYYSRALEVDPSNKALKEKLKNAK